MPAYTRVAYIVKTRNLEGSVVAQGAGGLPFLLREGLTVHFVPPALHAPRSARVQAVRQIRGGTYEVCFEGVGAIDEAQRLVGCYCLADDRDLPAVGSLERPDALLGFEVRDARTGPVGPVEGIVEGPAQALLSVAGPDGEVLIPVVGEFVVGIDEADRIIDVELPEGLLGLNAGGGGA